MRLFFLLTFALIQLDLRVQDLMEVTFCFKTTQGINDSILYKFRDDSLFIYNFSKEYSDLIKLNPQLGIVGNDIDTMFYLNNSKNDMILLHNLWYGYGGKIDTTFQFSFDGRSLNYSRMSDDGASVASTYIKDTILSINGLVKNEWKYYKVTTEHSFKYRCSKTVYYCLVNPELRLFMPDIYLYYRSKNVVQDPYIVRKYILKYILIE